MKRRKKIGEVVIKIIITINHNHNHNHHKHHNNKRNNHNELIYFCRSHPRQEASLSAAELYSTTKYPDHFIDGDIRCEFTLTHIQICVIMA